MNHSPALVERYIESALPLLADHVRALRALSAIVVEKRSDILGRWRSILDANRSLKHVTPARAASDLMEHTISAVLDGIGHSESAESYLERVAQWSRESRAAGLDLDDQFQFLTTLRRALIPAMMSTTTTGPELELQFNALDVLERVIVGVLATTAVQEAQAQLLQGAHLRSVGRLTGGIAHALNNALTVIIGHAQILEEEIQDPEYREELRAIQKTARAGADSLKRLQQFAGDGDGREPARIDVNALIGEVVQITRYRWRDDAEASGVTIKVLQELAPVPPVMGQAALLRDALAELILNSVEAMPLGGVVTMRTAHAADQVQITVADQGEGMDAARQARAAEAFFTTKGEGHFGLGLTTVAQIVQQMGGTYDVTSAPGEGTTVTLSFPVAPEKQPAPSALAARLKRWASILVVDDEPLVREMAVRTLQARGFRAVLAESGADALRVFKEQGPFEVVLVDLGMPGMNGFQTARALKDLSPRAVIILMTGWAAELDPIKLRETGIDRAITKPFEVDQVIELIGEALAIPDKR